MSAGLQVSGLLLGVASWCLQSSSTSSQVWKVRSQLESISSSQRQYEGLWSSCAASSLGSVQCSGFRTTLGLPAHLQACRALMILSLILGLVSIVVSILGLRCVKIRGTSEQVKEQINLSGGVLFILSGIFTLTAVSWFAARVIQEFYDPTYGGARFELGSGVYLGWASSCLAVLGGALLCASCRRRSIAPIRHFSYNFSSSGPNIYRAPTSTSSSGSRSGSGSKAAYV